jgi:transposase
MKGKVKNMTDIRNIIHRLRMGQTKRQIHRDLGVHRSTIRELNRLAIAQQWLDNESPMPSDEEISKFWKQKTKTKSHPLDIHKEQIEIWDKEDLTSVVIHQLLKDKCSCDVQTIRRYRSKHFPKPVEPVMVRFTVPGRDMELDFGELGKFLDDDQTEKKVWLFSLRLRHSRKVYREIVLDQTIHTFLMGHVHAFEYFNGVPKNCIMDNLKAAVIRSTIDNDMINRSYQDLAEHYAFIISPCLPRTPEHKGGVEGDVKYTKRNFLPYFLAKQKEIGVTKPKIRDLREALEKWNKDVADIHIIHGVGRSPLELFKSEEEKALQSLPKDRWEPTSWCQCIVKREWRIMVNSAYYSVPYQLIGESVDVCMTYSLVRIFHKHKEIALHEKATKKWEYKRKAEHAPPFKEAVLQCSRDGLLALAGDIGEFTHQVAYNILSHPSIDKLKPVRHMLKLAEKHSKERLEKACQRASNCKLYSYVSVKNILENNLESQPVDNQEISKIIPMPRSRFARDPADYKSSYTAKETFEEKLKRLHPYSEHGNAMQEGFEGLLADWIMKEEK